MKNRILVLVSVLVMLGFTMAFANTAGRIIDGKSMSCSCCRGDSCPMKDKDKTSADAKSCCDNCDCCKGDDCPMKMKHDQKDSMAMPMAKDAKTGDVKSCDCSCCQHDKNVKTDG